MLGGLARDVVFEDVEGASIVLIWFLVGAGDLSAKGFGNFAAGGICFVDRVD